MPPGSRLRGDRAGVPLDLEVTLELGSGKRAKLNGAKLRAAEQLRERGDDARLHAGPAGGRQGRTCGEARVLRSGARPPRAGQGRPLRRVRRGGRPAQRGAEAGGAGLSDAGGARALERAGEPSRRRARRRASRDRCGAAAALRGARRRARAGEAELRYEGEAPTVGAAGGAHRPRPRARDDRYSARIWTTSAFSRPSATCARFGSQGEQRLAVLALLLGEAELLEERRGTRPLLLLDDVLSELDPDRRRILADRLRAGGQALVTSASRNALPGEPAQTLEVAQSSDGTSTARPRDGPDRRRGAPRARPLRNDRRDGRPRRRLARGGRARRWPRNAWPARLARDGTLHVNAGSSAWAFELQQLESEIVGQLRDVLGKAAPARLRFVPGRLPEPTVPADERRVDAPAGGYAGAGTRSPRLGGGDRVGRSAQIGRKSCAGEPRKGR